MGRAPELRPFRSGGVVNVVVAVMAAVMMRLSESRRRKEHHQGEQNDLFHGLIMAYRWAKTSWKCG